MTERYFDVLTVHLRGHARHPLPGNLTEVSVQLFGAARGMGLEAVGFLMLAHRIGPAELARQARIMVDAGAQCVYVVDSAGALILAEA